MSVPVGAFASKSRPITAVNWSSDSSTEKSSSPRKLAGNTRRPCRLTTNGFTLLPPGRARSPACCLVWPSGTVSTRARSRRRSPRERLLKAADELFYAEGINSVGIDRVIERADVARASLYSTFGSKDELIRAYLEQRMELSKTRLLAAVE